MMKDYMLEQYEDYMADNCTCDRDPDDCHCLTFEDFCTMHIEELKDEWAQLVYETSWVDASYG